MGDELLLNPCGENISLLSIPVGAPVEVLVADGLPCDSGSTKVKKNSPWPTDLDAEEAQVNEHQQQNCTEKEPDAGRGSGAATESGSCPAENSWSESNFLKFLITNFDESVLQYLDKESRDAVKKQTEIDDEKEFKRIKAAIENRVLQILLSQGSMTSPPNIGFFRQIVGTLANRYPYMFLSDPTKTVQGLTIRKFVSKGAGGVIGVSSLPKAMRQKFSRLLEDKNGIVREKKRALPDGAAETVVPKKKKKVYGVASDKYYVAATEDKENFIAELQHMETIEDREELFSRNRKDIQHILSTSTDMFSAVPHFFSSITHAEAHFEWLTGKNIARNINSELPRQLKLLRAVVLHMCPTTEFRLQLKLSQLKGGQLNASYIPEYVCLLRQLNFEWHQSRGGLFRYPGEHEPNSPHIFCSEGTETLRFDVHSEKKKIFANLNFNESVAAFFYVTFVGNLEYPQEGEAVAVWLQRKVAGINLEGRLPVPTCNSLVKNLFTLLLIQVSSYKHGFLQSMLKFNLRIKKIFGGPRSASFKFI